MRVFIERPDDPVGLSDCERVNERLSVLLDLEDPIPGPYTLEVSTPGLDRPLRTVSDCERFRGHRIEVRFRTAEARSRTVTGVLRRVDGGNLELDAGKGRERIAWDAVARARLAPDYGALMRGAARRNGTGGRRRAARPGRGRGERKRRRR